MFCCYLVQLERGAVSTCRITVKEENAAMEGTVPTKQCELSPMVTFPNLNSCFAFVFFCFFAEGDERDDSIQSQQNVGLEAP